MEFFPSNYPQNSSVSDKCYVVGLIGKSLRGKAHLSRYISEKNIFQDEEVFGETLTEDKWSKIQIFHDYSNQTVYLQLISVEDTIHMLNIFFKVSQHARNEEIHLLLQKNEYYHVNCLIFMFYVCHRIIVTIFHSFYLFLKVDSAKKKKILEEKSCFDLQYLQLFRVLQELKHHTFSSITKLLSSAQRDLKKNLLAPGRCVPFITFVFEMVSFLLKVKSWIFFYI